MRVRTIRLYDTAGTLIHDESAAVQDDAVTAPPIVKRRFATHHIHVDGCEDCKRAPTVAGVTWDCAVYALRGKPGRGKGDVVLEYDEVTDAAEVHSGPDAPPEAIELKEVHDPRAALVESREDMRRKHESERARYLRDHGAMAQQYEPLRVRCDALEAENKILRVAKERVRELEPKFYVRLDALHEEFLRGNG